MADLSAVLRKTIDALPSASPQLRAKVYDKARAAIARQIAAANPPLPDAVVEKRREALEEAIAATEAHYAGLDGIEEAPQAAPASPPPPAAPAMPPQPAPPRAPEPEPAPSRTYEASLAEPVEEEARPVILSQSEHRTPVAPPPGGDEPEREEPEPYGQEEPEDLHRDHAPERQAPSAFTPPPPLRETEPSDGSAMAEIPEADLAAPAYTRRKSGSRRPLLTSLGALAFVGALGAIGYLYSDEIRGALGNGEPEVAALPPAEEEPEGEAAEEPTATEEAETPPDPSSRSFTQRLMPDGSEVDEGPAQVAANVFDEGTDVSPASPILATEPQAEIETPPPPPADDGAVPVGQRAVFYEERSGDLPGSQRAGNVVWSLVEEPPVSGQPAEPAIRAVADVGETGMTLTMTIRRNGDATLPASHVIELLFDTPANFEGGEIENVQRLALKPTEQARGEPLIGVAGKISDGFFIIALNDLQQAVENNTALMLNQQWIDIPLAYSTGQRALMSLEKGIPGERVFQEAINAWSSEG